VNAVIVFNGGRAAPPVYITHPRLPRPRLRPQLPVTSVLGQMSEDGRNWQKGCQ